MKTPLLFHCPLALPLCLAVLLAGSARAQIGPGYALNFDGVNDYVSVSHNASLNAYPLTISAWVKTSRNAAVADGIISKYIDASANGYSLFLYNGRVRGSYFRDSANYVWDGSLGLDGGVIADGAWHHVAFLVDAEGGRLLVDGVVRATLPWTGIPGAPTSTVGFQIGRYWTYNTAFLGQIDEVSVWNMALTTAQVQANMHQRLTGSEPNLAAYWRFECSSCSYVPDNSGHGNIGFFINGPTSILSGVTLAPDVATEQATMITFTSATLNGSFNPNNLVTTPFFQWGATTNYEGGTIGGVPSGGNNAISWSYNLTGLNPNVVYRFRLGASNSAGTNFGADFGFIGLEGPWPNTVNLGQNAIGTVTDDGGEAGRSSYTIVGGGNDIWDQHDEMTYAYQEIIGDFDVQVRVESLTPNARWSRAGLMVREALSEYSRMAFVRVTPPDVPTSSGGNGANDTFLSYRTGILNVNGLSGGQHEDRDVANTIWHPNYPNGWLRMARIGSVIYGSNSLDGVTWNYLSSQDTATWNGGPFGPSVLLGLAVSRHSGGPTATAEFRDYSLAHGSGAPFNVIGASSRGNPTGIRIYFNRPPGAGATTAANYTLNGAATVTSAATVAGNGNVIQLTTSTLVEGTLYIVGVDPFGVFDASGGSLVNSSADFVHGAGFEAQRIRINHSHTDNGGLYRVSQAVRLGLGELTPLGGGTFPGLQSNTVFEDPIPDSPSNEQFSSRISGVLNITNTGNYIFYMSSDDAGVMYLSADDDPAHKVPIASEPSWNGVREYIAGGYQLSRGSPPANISAPQSLVAGRKYYLEVIYTEGGGANNGSATWLPPGGPAVTNGSSPIAEANFAPSRVFGGTVFTYLGDITIVSQPVNASKIEGQPATFTVRADGTPLYRYQWRRNGQDIAGANGATYTIPVTLPADNGAVFSVIVANEFSSMTSSNAMLIFTGASLEIARIGINRVVLSWLTNSTGFQLESKASLAPGPWNPVTPSPLVVSDRNVITNTVSDVSQFYRLRKP